MRNYALMYLGWLLGVLAMAAIAAVWYKHVEEIGISELADHFRAPDAPGPIPGSAPDATEATDGESHAA